MVYFSVNINTRQNGKFNSPEFDVNHLTEIITSDSLFDYPSQFKTDDSLQNLEKYSNSIKSFSLKRSEFKCETISTRQLRKFDRDWKKFYDSYGGIYFNISLPIFNQKKDFAYFTFKINTYGVGHNFIGIYEKKNGKWRPITITRGVVATNGWR